VCPRCHSPLGDSAVRCTACGAFVAAPAAGDIASVPLRLMAYLLDQGIGAVIIVIVLYAAVLSPLSAVVILIAAVALFVQAFREGRSPGKALVGLTVYHADGRRAQFWTMFFREGFGKWVSSLLLHLGFAWAIWDRDKQTWHDKMFSTVVVHRGSSDGYAVPALRQTANPAPTLGDAPTVTDAGRSQFCTSCGRALRPHWTVCPYCHASTGGATGTPEVALVDGSGDGRKWAIGNSSTIGRGTSCEIHLDDGRGKVSREHARITRRGSAVVIEDLASTNGTRVNGARITRKDLREGDLIEIGSFKLRFRMASTA